MNKALFLAIGTLALSACDHDGDAKSAWNEVIKKCATNDLSGKTTLYFGPSNVVGPGSIWRSGSNGGYRIRYTLTDMPGAQNFITSGAPSKCDGTNVTKFGVKASAGLTTAITPASVDISNDFQKAKNIDVKVSSIQWDVVREGPYENYIKGLPAAGGAREDLSKGDRLVLYRALRVSGYSATLEFSESDAVGLKAKYSGKLTKGMAGELGAEMSASWSENNKLTLTSNSDFYIAGELVPFKAGEFAAGGASRFGAPLEVSNLKSLGVDQKN